MTNQAKILIAVILLIVAGGAGAYILMGGSPEEAPREDLLETPEREQIIPIDEPMEEPEEESASEEPQEEPVAEELQIIAVAYTNAGFSLSAVDGVAGQSVLFINQSSASLQVSSDPHPTHTDCPQYNANTIAPGTEIEIKLIEGACGIHNHLNPSHTTTLIAT
ncbi:MAG: hypothetical protein WD712_00575 [Candidatus Spechtbacterales bacterium]